jgi:DNA-binding response OmpR family regulator
VPDSACLPRPFGPRTLVARVRAALATDGVSASATGSDHALQPFADVALTATERELLAVLLASPGRVFTRERLLAAIAVTADGPGPRAVDVYVSQLRAKLGDRSPIRTARGVGYSAQPQRPQQRRD